MTRLKVLAAVANHGSVTRAAQALNYSQPSVSHHLARLEAETGVRLVQRVGRGVRLTEAGRTLAERADELLGRLDAAEYELAAFAGLKRGRARLAAFPSAFSTVVPEIVTAFTGSHPELDLHLAEAEPPEALRMLREGDVDVALVFSHDLVRLESMEGLRTAHLFDEPLYLVLPRDKPAPASPQLVDYAEAAWIAGCERCRKHLLDRCAAAGFEPDITFSTDDFVAVQALVAAGVGVSTLPELALAAHRHPEVAIAPLPGDVRHVLTATYGNAPDPPAVAALLDALRAPDHRRQLDR